jgi:hypothetical protein
LIFDVEVSAGMVDEECPSTVFLMCLFSPSSGREATADRRLVLVNRNTLTRRENVMGQDVFTVRACGGGFGAGRATAGLGGITSEALGVRAVGNGGMARGKAALALFGTSVEGTLGIGRPVETLKMVEVKVAEALVVEQELFLCAGEVSIGGIKDANVCGTGGATVATFARTISRGGAGSNDHGNVAARVDITTDVFVAVGDLKPGGGGIALI